SFQADIDHATQEKAQPSFEVPRVTRGLEARVVLRSLALEVVRKWLRRACTRRGQSSSGCFAARLGLAATRARRAATHRESRGSGERTPAILPSARARASLLGRS